MIGIPIGVRSTKLQNIYEIAHSYNLFIAQTHILIFMKDKRVFPAMRTREGIRTGIPEQWRTAGAGETA